MHFLKNSHRVSSRSGKSHHRHAGSSSKPSGTKARTLEGPADRERKRVLNYWCDIEYRATLPDIPLGGKFMRYPHCADSVVGFDATELEMSQPWQMYREGTFPVPFDLMDPSVLDELEKDNIDEGAAVKAALSSFDHSDELLLKSLDSLLSTSRSAAAAGSTSRKRTMMTGLDGGASGGGAAADLGDDLASELDDLLGITEDLDRICGKMAEDSLSLSPMKGPISASTMTGTGSVEPPVAGITEVLPSFLNRPTYGKSVAKPVAIGSSSMDTPMLLKAKTTSSAAAAASGGSAGKGKKEKMTLDRYKKKIEESFKAVDRAMTKHPDPRKRKLKVAQFYDILPDMNLSEAFYKHVIFPHNPLTRVKKIESIEHVAAARGSGGGSDDDEDVDDFRSHKDDSKRKVMIDKIAGEAFDYNVLHPTINTDLLGFNVGTKIGDTKAGGAGGDDDDDSFINDEDEDDSSDSRFVLCVTLRLCEI